MFNNKISFLVSCFLFQGFLSALVYLPSTHKSDTSLAFATFHSSPFGCDCQTGAESMGNCASRPGITADFRTGKYLHHGTTTSPNSEETQSYTCSPPAGRESGRQVEVWASDAVSTTSHAQGPQTE